MALRYLYSLEGEQDVGLCSQSANVSRGGCISHSEATFDFLKVLKRNGVPILLA